MGEKMSAEITPEEVQMLTKTLSKLRWVCSKKLKETMSKESKVSIRMVSYWTKNM